jgi:hypothetical protein
MPGGGGRCSTDFEDQVIVEHPLQSPLQGSAADNQTDRLKTLDGHLVMLKKTKRLHLALIQSMLLTLV